MLQKKRNKASFVADIKSCHGFIFPLNPNTRRTNPTPNANPLPDRPTASTLLTFWEKRNRPIIPIMKRMLTKGKIRLILSISNLFSIQFEKLDVTGAELTCIHTSHINLAPFTKYSSK
jgi:predicted ATPase